MSMPGQTIQLLVDGKTVNTSNPLHVYLQGSTVFGQIKPANYLYVGKNGNDSTGDGSAGNPYLTISAAVTAASSGTTIWIFPGTYTENITFKAGVNITAPIEYGVYITGNHIANFSGTVICENIVLQNAASAASGTTLTISGSSALNIQFLTSYINSQSSSGAGDAINWTNTNSSSKLQFLDGNVNVLHSGSTARAFYSTTGAVGSIITNRATFKLDNYDNVCLSIGGGISFTHTADTVYGQVVVSGTASYTGALLALTTSSVAVLTTSSSGTSVLLSVLIATTASPAITGAGGFTFNAIQYLSTGVGGASTLNGGYGPLPLTMAPFRLRTTSLYPSGSVSAGLLGGTFEFDGTKLYFTAGTNRDSIATSKIPVTAVTASGAITITSGAVINAITATSAAVLTVAAPSSVDGTVISIISTTAYAHTITFTGTNLYAGTSSAKLTATFAAYAGANIEFVSYGTKWYLKSLQGVTLS